MLRFQCYCDYREVKGELEGIEIDMEYKGKGIFQCPKCNREENLLEVVYKLKLKIDNIEGFNELEIIDSDKDISQHFYNDPSHLIIKDCIQDDLNEDICLNGWLKEQKEGIIEIELLYEPYSYQTDYGTEYDLNMELLNEGEYESICKKEH